jgi:putative transposase
LGETVQGNGASSELEAETARLKRMYIEEKLKAEIVTEALAKKW